jgi:hypothetical protein
MKKEQVAIAERAVSVPGLHNSRRNINNRNINNRNISRHNFNSHMEDLSSFRSN